MLIFRWDEDVQDGEQFIESVEFSDAIDYVVDQSLQGDYTAHEAAQHREMIADFYNPSSPMKLHVGNAVVAEQLVPFRLLARGALEAKFAAKRHFGDVPISVRAADGRRRRPSENYFGNEEGNI